MKPQKHDLLSGEESTAESDCGDRVEDWRTTIMIKGLAPDDTVQALVEMLVIGGFGGHFDYVFVPVDRTETVGVYRCFGNAFVNFLSHQWASAALKLNVTRFGRPMSARWADIQGCEANLQRYWDRAAQRGMRGDFSATCRPWLFLEQAFPAPIPPALQSAIEQQRSDESYRRPPRRRAKKQQPVVGGA